MMRRYMLAAALLALVTGVASGQDAASQSEEPKAEAEVEAAEKAPEKPAEAAKPAPAEEAKPAADAKKPAADAKATPQKFIPSEQVRSDFDVSFPVDI